MNLQVIDSTISGRGVSATKRIQEGTLLWKAYNVDRKHVIELGATCFINHSPNPNIKLVKGFMLQPYFISSREIVKGEELTCDYQDLEKKLKESYGFKVDLMCFLRDSEEYQRMCDSFRIFHPQANVDVGNLITLNV